MQGASSLKDALKKLSHSHFLTYEDENVCLTDTGRSFLIEKLAATKPQKRNRSPIERPVSNRYKRPVLDPSDDNFPVSDDEIEPSMSEVDLSLCKRRGCHSKSNGQPSTNALSVLVHSFRQSINSETAAVPEHVVSSPTLVLQVSSFID
jgi:hypothetical protein